MYPSKIVRQSRFSFYGLCIDSNVAELTATVLLFNEMHLETIASRSVLGQTLQNIKTIEPEGKRVLVVYNPVCDDIFCPCDPVGGRSCVGPVLRRSPPVVFQALPFVGRSPVQVLGWLS